MRWSFICIALIATLSGANACAARSHLQSRLRRLEAQSDGRVGICALEVKLRDPTCINGDQRFPLQSVMKLVVAAAVMDAVDRRLVRLEDVIVVRPEDASPGPQDFSALVRRQGRLETTLEDLVRRAVIDSDSTSVDVLIKHLGGTVAVQKFLKRKGFEDVRIDRDERHLQSESTGIVWRAEYANADAFETAANDLSAAKRESAWHSYLNDARDTATPEGMVRFLQALASGQLLSARSTQKLLGVMEATVTGVDRLKAGLPQGWRLGHKTGTGRIWNGMRSATNDVGILTAADGRQIAIAVFISASRRSDAQQTRLIADAAALVAAAYPTKQ